MAEGVKEAKNRRFSQVFDHDNDITRAEALKHCSNFLGGSWETLTEENFHMQVVRGGLVDRIFLCENKGGASVDANETTKVILRLYGGKVVRNDRSDKINMEEVLVCYAMGNLGLGPKLLGIFPGGRLEQYLECRTFNDGDFLNPEMEALFARKLARMHVVKMPFSRVTEDLIESLLPLLADWLDTGKAELEATEPEAGEEEYRKYVLGLDIEKDVQWLNSLKPRIKTRRVLIHEDMNRDNCLVLDKAENPIDKLILVDYESSKYGPRGDDIGSHFYNRLVDFAKVDGKFISGMRYPTEDERRHFIRSYNEEMKHLNSYDLDESENGLDNEDNMLAEAEFWVLGYFLFFRLIRTNRKYSIKGLDNLRGFKLLAQSQQEYEMRRKEFIEKYLPKLTSTTLIL
ncbi:Choline kinase alpha [Halotydeus destructor]|nr:Choline kinase alpha [Halotydeus destructor]